MIFKPCPGAGLEISYKGFRTHFGLPAPKGFYKGFIKIFRESSFLMNNSPNKPIEKNCIPIISKRTAKNKMGRFPIQMP